MAIRIADSADVAPSAALGRDHGLAPGPGARAGRSSARVHRRTRRPCRNGSPHGRQLQAAELRSGLQVSTSGGRRLRRPGCGLHQRPLPSGRRPRRQTRPWRRLRPGRRHLWRGVLDRGPVGVHRPADQAVDPRRGRLGRHPGRARLRARGGGPARRVRWVGRARVPSEPGKNPDAWVCPRTGESYVEHDNPLMEALQ
jgi:hypothetical protein